MPDTHSFWRERRVFITGATGFLGAWLVQALADRSAYVVALVRDSDPHSNFYLLDGPRRATVVRGDICDFPLLQRVVQEYEPDTIFHLAAQSLVPVANRLPVATFETNIRGTWNLLEAARGAARLRALVMASSDKAYGDQARLPYQEDTPLGGRYPYDVSKSCADLIAHSYFHTYNLPVCVTRCGNLFGGGDFNFSRLVPGTIRSVLAGNAPVIRSDGQFVRDYLYVEDAVDAYLALAEAMERAGVAGEAFNFSLEQPLTVLAMTDLVLRLMDRTDLQPVVQNVATAEIREQFLSSEKARRLLGWRPEHGLEAGLRATIVWYREHGHD